MRESDEGGLVHEFSLPPTRNSLPSEKATKKTKRVTIGIIVFREAIDSNTLGKY
jgi:hypothetical protein